MIKIISKKRYDELIRREFLFQNPKVEVSTYEDLQELFKVKKAELMNIKYRINLIQKTHSSLTNTNGNNIKQYAKRNKIV